MAGARVVSADTEEFREPWFRVAGDGAAPFEAEAHNELHTLDLRALARCAGCDDVVFQVSDGSFAIVHLTWTGKPDVQPWPRTTRLGGFIAVEMAMDQHEH